MTYEEVANAVKDAALDKAHGTSAARLRLSTVSGLKRRGFLLVVDLTFDCGRHGSVTHSVYIHNTVAGMDRADALRQCRMSVDAVMLAADREIAEMLGPGRG